MPRKIRKAVIPAAGYGTRFLPVTKASPKEMLPIVDKPVVQYVVEEAVAAGIEEVIFITSSNKRTLEDHFDYNFELEEKLKGSGKAHLYDEIRRISDMARFVYIRQKEARGNGHAVLMAKDLIGDEPFLVLWGDEFVSCDPSRSAQLVEAFHKTGSSVIAAFETADAADTKKYGYVDGEQENDLVRVRQLIEKPGPDKAPSNLAVVGGYVFNPTIFPVLESLPERHGEKWLADAVHQLAQTEPVFARVLENATYYDSGSKFGFIKANIDYGLKHPETKEPLLEYLRQLRDA